MVVSYEREYYSEYFEVLLGGSCVLDMTFLKDPSQTWCVGILILSILRCCLGGSSKSCISPHIWDVHLHIISVDDLLDMGSRWFELTSPLGYPVFSYQLRRIYTIACILFPLVWQKCPVMPQKKLSDFFRHFPQHIVSLNLLFSYYGWPLV